MGVQVGPGDGHLVGAVRCLARHRHALFPLLGLRRYHHRLTLVELLWNRRSDGGRADGLDALAVPALCLHHRRDGSSLDDRASIRGYVVRDAVPPSAQPHSVLPPFLQFDVGDSVLRHPPMDSFAEFVSVFMRSTCEEPFVGSFAVPADQISGDGVRRMLHQPGHDWMVTRDPSFDTAFQSQKHYSEDPLE